jgi:uncharacterized protein YggE
VIDPKKLEDRAYAAALARAKVIAEQSVNQMGVNLRGIIAIANSTNPSGRSTRAAF